MKKYATIFITGASSGIGAALATNYAQKGITLFLCGRNKARLDDVVKSCQNKGATVYSFIFDVQDEKEALKAILKAESIAPIELLIANAGVSSGILGLQENIDATRAIMSTNIFGVLNTVLPLIDIFKSRQSGHIAIMSSMAGYRGLMNCPAYSASKNCVKAWGEALRGQLYKDNIKVSVICPGFVKTPLTDANAFNMPLLMTPEKAVDIIKNGIAKNKALIAFPTIMRFFVWIMAILPTAFLLFILQLLPKKEK